MSNICYLYISLTKNYGEKKSFTRQNSINLTGLYQCMVTQYDVLSTVTGRDGEGTWKKVPRY